MSQIKPHYYNGFISTTELAKIVADMADDIIALKAALENHQHTENTGGAYAQNATVAKTGTVVTIKTSKAPY